jgi:hypothetical protein
MTMRDETDSRLEPWLETIAGDAPLLLIAPHGGRAGHATRALLNPKVNDLYTAEITRELAAMLGAPALINAAMDRNHLDLNRLSQVTANAPWFLDAIVSHIEEIVARHGHVTVLVVHGWNIIQARIDLGVGLRRHGDELRPPGAAHISASDEFIHGRLGELGEHLRAHGILATFGLRYPAGGAQNLLQAFTARHLESQTSALRELSAMASRGQIDAVQLELSVALRMPGALRRHCIAAIAEVFGQARGKTHEASFAVVRSSAAKPASVAKRAAAPAPASRVGIEWFDPSTRVGAMASFDLGAGGAGGAGARIMVLLPGGRVALFTGEGRPRLDDDRLSLGPLALAIDGGGLLLSFSGHAVVVPDSTHYLSIERALASGWLDESMEVTIRMRPHPGSDDIDFSRLLSVHDAPGRDSSAAIFGPLTGMVKVDGVAAEISGFGRSGLSFTGLGPQRFRSRRMMWACFADSGAPAALELRAVSADDGEHRSGRILHRSGWDPCEVGSVEVETRAVAAPPERIWAGFRAGGAHGELEGSVENFIPLSRPGPDNTRIFTALGFARFRLGKYEGAGMFESSRRADEMPERAAEENED